MTDQSRRILVTGATGSVGPALVNRLLRAGAEVRVLSRRPVPAWTFGGPVEVAVGDITDSETVRSAVADANSVFHLAAKLHSPDPDDRDWAEYERVNAGGTETVLEAARAEGVERVVLFSTVSVYGPTGEAIADEGTPVAPATSYARSKVVAEQMALEAKTAGGSPLAVVLRMAAIYGPRMKGNYARLVDALAGGLFVPVGDGTNVRTLVYEADAARAAELAASHPDAAGRIYNVSDGELHSFQEILAAMSAALGKSPPRRAIPLRAARLAAAVADRATGAVGRSTCLTSAVDKLVESAAVRADRIRNELGFRPEYDLARGWRETIAVLSGSEVRNATGPNRTSKRRR